MPDRIAELQHEVDAANRRFDRHFASMQAKSSGFVDRAEADADSRIMAGLQASVDLARARLANAKAGLPPDHGIAPPANIEAIVNGRIAKAMEEMAQALGDVIGQMLQPIRERLDQIEKAGIRFCGVHQRAMDYAKGSLVTCQGSLWAAARDVAAGEPSPGEPGPWVLCVKAGKDAPRGRDLHV